MPIENRSSNTEQMVRGLWVACGPEWLEAGGDCATAPRICCEAGQGISHLHPAQHQGEPVAFYREFVDGREYCEKPFTNDWTPLYTHADAGRVERLHNSHVKSLEALNQQSEKQRDHWIDECKTLRAQLAERDALLRKIAGYHWANVDPEERARTRAELRDLLSASAEPSAPVERDELVPAALMLRQTGFGNLADAVDEARAALERKP